MAKAPAPGAQRIKAQRAQMREGLAARFRITVGDETRILHLADLGPADNIACRQATGMPYTAFLQHLGPDSFAVIWWLAACHDGQPTLTFQKVLTDWPSDAEMVALADAGKVTLEQVDADEDTEEDSPEA